MADDTLTATITVTAPAEAVFGVLADPARHGAIDGTGWVREPLDGGPLTEAGQTFRMAMYVDAIGDYEMVNKIRDFDPPRRISWEPGRDSGDGEVRYGGWSWRYDMEPISPRETKITLTYDWSAVPQPLRERISFPPFGQDHLDNSLSHLAELATGAR